MGIARYDVILDQSERAHLYDHLSSYTNINYSIDIIKFSLQTYFVEKKWKGPSDHATIYPADDDEDEDEHYIDAEGQ